MAKKDTNLTTQELKQIQKIFEQEDTSKNKLGLSLIDKAMFMEQTLNKLQEKIEKDGVVTEMCQGTYTIERENPALKSYTSLIKNYNSIIKQISDLLPVEAPKEEEDAFESFE